VSMNFDREIQIQLVQVSPVHRVAFGSSCCERMLPNYLAFQTIENWGDFRYLRNALDRVWSSISKQDLYDLTRISTDRIINLAPDTEDYTTVFTSLAGDAVAGVTYAIEALLDPAESLKKSALISQVALNSVFQYLAAVNDPHPLCHVSDTKFEQSLFTHPIMLEEISRQEADIKVLVEIPVVSEEIIMNLKDLSSRSGLQPIARGLAPEGK
jgi:uncharacterized protein YjaG (DUF416 family)